MAENWPLRIEQGTTFLLQFRWRDEVTGALVDLTGYTAASQLRSSYNAEEPLVVLSTDVDGGITIEDNVVSMVIEADVTAGLTVPVGAPFRKIQGADYYEIGRWDFEFTVPSTSQVIRFLSGPVYLSPEVTRALPP